MWVCCLLVVCWILMLLLGLSCCFCCGSYWLFVRFLAWITGLGVVRVVCFEWCVFLVDLRVL